MPPVIISAALSAGAAFAFEGTFLGLVGIQAALAIGGVSLIMGGLQYALAPKPKKGGLSGNFEQINSSTFAVRQTDSTRKHIYGMTRYADCYAQIVSTGVNGKIHAVVIVSDDQAAGWTELWVDDYPISPDDLDADGNVINGRYSGFLRVRVHLGSPDQAADTFMVSEVDGWTTRCRLQGIFYFYVTLTKSQDVYPNGMPNFSIIARVRQIYDPRTSMSRWTPNTVLFGYDFLNQADFGFEANDDDINLTNISAQANIADEIVDTIDSDMVVTSIDTATDIITLTGDMLLYEVCDRVEIIASGSPPAGLSTGVDYYVIPYQIKNRPRIRLATTLDNAIDGNYINITSSGSGTITVRKNGEPRYHGAGVIDTADVLQDSINAILSGMGGRATLTGGAWRLLAGAWQEPSLELGIGDMRGGMGTRSKVAMADRFNTISGLHISQLNSYQRADYPPYRNQDYIDADLNEYPKDYPLNFTSRPTTAKRIVKLEVLRARLEKIFTAPFSMKAMLAQAGDNISLTLSRRGWASKAFEMTNFAFSVMPGDDNNQELVTSLTLRETDESIYAWAASEDDPPLNLAPNSNLPDPFNVNPVTGLFFSSRASGTAGGDTVYTLVLGWNPHDDAFVINFGQMEIQYRETGEVDYRPSFFVSGALTFSDVLVSSVNTQYDLRIRAMNNLGVRSAWSYILNATVGSSGGVGATLNYGLVTDIVLGTVDNGLVTDAVGATDDYQYVV